MEEPDVDRKKILRWNFKKGDVRTSNWSSWLRIGTGGAHCECGNKPLGSKKYGEFFDYLIIG